MRLTCGKCDNGWICESIPTSRGRMTTAAGRVCRARTPRATSASSQLVWSARAATAHNAQGEIKTQTHRVIGFACRECGYRWHAETGRVAGDILRGNGRPSGPE